MIDDTTTKPAGSPRCCPLLYFLYLIYLLYFHILTDTPTQRPLINPFAINLLRTLLISTGGVPSSRSRLPIPHSLSPTCPVQNACFALRMVLRNRPKVPTLSDGIPFLVTSLRTLSHFFALFCTHQ